MIERLHCIAKQNSVDRCYFGITSARLYQRQVLFLKTAITEFKNVLLFIKKDWADYKSPGLFYYLNSLSKGDGGSEQSRDSPSSVS